MTAINYQSFDLGKLINSSLFACNGKTGYILKPSFMRDPSVLFDLHGENLASPSIRVVFSVVSGFNLPKAEGISGIISPFVELAIIGLPQDGCSQRTGVIEKNGFNPV